MDRKVLALCSFERIKKYNHSFHGGPQERNMRGGTENVYGIIGLAKALEIAYRDLDEHKKYITD